MFMPASTTERAAPSLAAEDVVVDDAIRPIPAGKPPICSKKRTTESASIVKDHVQERTVNFETAVVFDEPELAKTIHEEVHP